jgi:NADH-quinone oxidoreductase subunit N
MYLLSRWDKGVITAGVLIAGGLAWAAWVLPIGEMINVGPWSFQITDTLFVLGRRFILQNQDRPILILIYLAAAFWFGGGYCAKPGRMFTPLGLGVIGLMTAAFAVEPFLYAALFIEVAALICVPILLKPGGSPGRGVLRFITFQTLGTPFILLTGWLLVGMNTGPGEIIQIGQALVLLAIGFSFLLAVFPFHTWIPMLSEEAHPYSSAFVFFMLPGIVSLFALTFLDRYAWLRNSQDVYLMLRTAGAVMIFTGGLWAAFQRHLGRLLGYTVIVDIGLSLLAIGLAGGGIFEPFLGSQNTHPSLTIFFTLFITRGFSLGLWSLGLSALSESSPDLSFRAVQGLGRKLPLAAGGIVLAHLSMAGFPLLAGFPVRIALWENLFQVAPLNIIWALLGTAGLLVGAMRTLAVLVMGKEETTWQLSENRTLQFLTGIGIAVLIFLGIVPYMLR